MELLKFIIKSLFILATIIFMAAPLALEFYTFRRDKENKISYKRFRIVIYTAIYVVAITITLLLFKEFILWLESLSFVQWIVGKIALSSRVTYCAKVIVAILVNFAIGFVYRFFGKFVRIGLKKKSILKPKKKNGEFSWGQKFERGIVKFFHTETWYFVGNILKYLSVTLSVIYAVIFIVYQVPAMFGADWIPYDFISTLFGAGYIYPTITLLALWEMFFFLEGIKRLEEECPEILEEETVAIQKAAVDLEEIDAAVRKQFKQYYVCDVDLSETVHEAATSSHHNEITDYIAHAVESDKRNPQKRKEIFLNCLDRIIECDHSILVNGSFFSEFSMYFFRYISAIVARGDNVVFVCNSDSQIEEVYQYLREGISEISSLYCAGFQSGAVDYDDPVWRIVKINGEADVLDEAAIDENSILITSLSYLCSTHFESEHSKFIHLLDTIVFVDALKTVNTYNRQLAMLNTRLKHITKNNALRSKNGNINKKFRVRYMSKQVRYICFDDTRTPGLDKVLKNLLAVDFDSADAMNYNPSTIVRCYSYEGSKDDFGRRNCSHFFDTNEEVGALMSMALLCLSKGASNVNVFVDDSIPYANIAETIAANMGRVSIKVDGSRIRLNTPHYNPDGYSVLIVMDSSNNLPATIRRYISMVSDKPTLVIVFSRPYMLRDYYVDNINALWSNTQLELIPVEEGTKKDVAQRILVKANAGGISENEILKLASGVAQFDAFVQKRDISGILRAVLEIYCPSQKGGFDLSKYFEYSSFQDFDENGVFSSEDKVLLRRQGKLFDMVNGRDMVVLQTNESDIILPLPKKRLTQNYIAGQNLLHNGNIYHIDRIDTKSGRIHARLAVGGRNDEVYQYVQAREYHVELNPERVEAVLPTKHVVLKQTEEDVSASDVYISVFRAPMEVLTNGYFEIDPHTLAINSNEDNYHSISDPGNDELAKHTYRRYGLVSQPACSSESIMQSSDSVSSENGALMMSIKISGQFGSDVSKTATLAAVMLNELLRAMFPSVSDSIAVCPIVGSAPSDDESVSVLQKQPCLKLVGDDRGSSNDFELMIIEDCETDLGVVSVLMSAGNDVLSTLFNPIYNYLNWYKSSNKKSDYLYYGLDHEPSCFDFAALFKLSKLLGDDKHDLVYVDLETVMEYDVCDFCGKRYAKGDDVVILDDGRKMCRSCAQNLVGNNRKTLKAHLDSAKIFLESTYGIILDDDYEFCFESSVKIINTLKQNRDIFRRGADIPLKSYVDDKKKVHAEYSLPSVNLSELLVRELTHVWQLKHLPELSEELAEGHIALVALQYLRFVNQHSLATVRTLYYESTSDVSGEGYRRLVRALLENPQYNNNPFRYLLEASGTTGEDAIIPPAPKGADLCDYGLPYVPDAPDRALDGNINYFYYSRMTASCQKAYDILLAAIQNHEATATVEALTSEEITKVSIAILYDHPELFWYKTCGICGTTVTLFYGASAEEAEVLKRRIDEAVPKYLKGIEDTMSAYDAALRVYANVITAADYDGIALQKEKEAGGPAVDKIDYLRTICGVFINGTAVCEGYARAVQYLLQKCGIECAEAVGKINKEPGERDSYHAWNIVKIDGDYYYLDATWDDSSNTVQIVKSDFIGFTYFCINTAEILQSRAVDRCPTDVPICDATRCNYYYHNARVLDNYDLNRIKSIAQTAANNQSGSFTFKCKTKAVYDQALAQLCLDCQNCLEVIKAAAKVNKKIDAGKYTYRHDGKILTITIYFKFK